MTKKNIRLLIAFSIIPQYIIITLLSFFPEFVETYYSCGFYPFLSTLFRTVFGKIPFSVGDVFYTLAIVCIIRWFYINWYRFFKTWKSRILDIFIVFSFVYFVFHLFWGLNYYRVPLHKTLRIETDYNLEQLISVTEKLIKKSNSIHLDITHNDSTKVTIPYNKKTLRDNTLNGYNALSKVYPHLSYTKNSTKFSLYSLGLTYMGFSGYLNPFTNEAQINQLIPLHKIPTTTAHEQAHQIGYAAENETNFIGCLASLHNSDTYFNYSGYIFALRYCLNAIYIQDVTRFNALYKTVNYGITLNYKESKAFWESYRNPLEPAFKLTYDQFLKANNQEKGISSYSNMVSLTVNYFKHVNL